MSIAELCSVALRLFVSNRIIIGEAKARMQRRSAGILFPLQINYTIMGTLIKDTMATGAVATTASTLLLAVLGKNENGSATSAINAVSHMLWGEEATASDQLDAKHTLAGAGLNGAAMMAWAGMHEMLLPRNERPSVGRALLAGATTATVAYVVDYHVVPKRFTPGFEERLTRRSLLGVYVTMAAALAVGSLWRRGKRS